MVKTIALDIGHGIDTFPPSKGIYKGGKAYPEHDFNSKLSIEIDKLLRGNGFKVIMYQKPYSKDVPLLTRTNYYNSKKVDLVYSTHANYSDDSAVNGRCAFYWHTAKDSKRLAEIVINEINKAGYSTHGNGLHPSERGSWTNLHICRETNMTAVLVENGFMSGSQDFDLIFGSKQKQYIEDMAIVHTKAICKYFGVTYEGKKASGGSASTPSKPSTPSPKPSTEGKSVSQMASEVVAGKHGSGHANRRKSLGINASEYEKVRAEVNKRAGVSSKPKPTGKSISQMATEVIAGKHGSGHANRRKSLGISSVQYEKVRAEVNKRAGGGGKSSGKSISQMATEVIRGDHGSGHANRRKSLGVSQAQYNKVRSEVNKRL